MRTVFDVMLWSGLVRMAHPTKFKSEQAHNALSMRLAEAHDRLETRIVVT